MKTKVISIALLCAFLLSPFLGVRSVAANENSANVVVCKTAPCDVLTQATVDTMRAQSQFWGLYLSRGNGQWTWEAHQAWSRSYSNGFKYPGFGVAIPDEVRIRRNSNTSIPRMGLYWWKNVLAYSQPGWMNNAEVPVALSDANALKTIKGAAIPQPTWKEWDNTIST